MKTDIAPAFRLADYAPSAFLIDHVEMTIRLDGPRTSVHGRYHVRPNPLVPADGYADTAQLLLDEDGIGAIEVHVNGALVEPRRERGGVILALSIHQASRVEIKTVLDPDANTALSGLYRTNGVYCTQCEAEGFRRIVPFLDRPDVLATYKVRLEARMDECPVLLSNGNPSAHEVLGNGWHAQTWDDPHPKPCYLFALVGGRLDVLEDSFTTSQGRQVALGIYVEPGKVDQAGFAMQALKRSMAWDETRFGRFYDLDVFNIVAVSDFNLGAMENKGLNIFNDKYILASPEIASDEDYERIEAIIAHEYFHNWSGNRVTCRDWFQLCLKEGLTVFRDQEYTSDLYDRAIKRIADVRTLWIAQFPEDGGPLAHPVRPDSYREINNFYTATVYEKGAEIVRMIATWLGPDRFRAAMDDYFSTHDGQAVRIEDFLACMQAKADPAQLGDWPDFFGWYQQAGTPQVEVLVDPDLAGGRLTLHLAQNTAPTPGQPTKKPLPIPCVVGLVDEKGQDIAAQPSHVEGGRWRDGLFLLEQERGSIRFDGLGQGTVLPSLFRDFSAPVGVTLHGLDEGQRLALATSDSNGFNRWSQLQSLYGEALQRRYARLAMGEPEGEDQALLAAIAAKLGAYGTAGVSPAILAAEITLPSSHDLARTLAHNVDPRLVEAAKRGFSADLCAAHGDVLHAALEKIGLVDDGEISPDAAARRSLLIALMDHLNADPGAHASAALAQAHDASNTMTMRIKTLALMVRSGHAGADDALAAYEARFGDNPLAMDKWLSLQASAPGGDALPIVERLCAHPAYAWSNPNRVRALWGAFSMNNLSGFHAADGSGYRALAAHLAAIDRNNPQLSARLASAFRTWRQFTPAHMVQAKMAMEGLLETPDLSGDLGDILDRVLAG